MKRILFAFGMMVMTLTNAQITANRFFYELTYKPSTKSDSLTTMMTILDITPEKSLYRDYAYVAQDSLVKAEVEKMMKAGNFNMKTLEQLAKKYKFSHKVTKKYPITEVKYIDQILNDQVSYTEKLDFKWKLSSEKQKIGAYTAQKATTTFGGRNWTAWFSNDLPFQDGPYKFNGLPGLIVKIEDSQKHYVWTLKGNEKVNNYNEKTYAEEFQAKFSGIKELSVSREKFDKMYSDYRKDPFGSIRIQLKNVPADAKMPDGSSVLETLKDQEAQLKKFLDDNDNLIEQSEPKKK
ncbi:MAG: GLPGLI family protein [Bergeyella zoohelcum]|nr:GLPGLI family protein [Bergeyella zoohelcum]